ncbi:hypothetical protein J4H86_05740 [Spiractinospora alimapuensis]|uniref:hypothetical protein n=1 Tax=Spiractinospora alimapuensis TaxID=2820884 RepID=UPI001F467BB0|nr:hypothetical protein [Spiractinospora alimapuensis]QVQ53274.1 hypothetical protein J4H86_05740 [Spiractinospora alimapuensis]
MKYRLAVAVSFATASGCDMVEAFDEFTNRVMDELLVLEEINGGIHDPDAPAGLTAHTLSVTLVVDAETRPDATVMFLDTVRTALQAAGGATGDRPHVDPKRPLTADTAETAAA